MDYQKLFTGDVMPIAGYYGPIASYRDKACLYTTLNYLEDKYFQMLVDCGLNLINTVDCDYTEEPENFIKTMDLCEKFGLGIFIKDRALETMEGEQNIIERMKAYSNYECFAGIRVIDEPGTPYYPDPERCGCPTRPLAEYGKIAKKLNDIPGLLGYVNLYPYYTGLRAVTFEDYKRYVLEYCERVPNLKVLSYDHYVFDEYDFKAFYNNMSFIRDVAREHNIPFWAYLQCGGQWNRQGMTSLPIFPADGEFYWNGNVTLAMGARGIQYFPTIAPHGDSINEKGEIDPCRNGLIAADGSATPWYYMAMNFNKQVAAVDEVLMNAEHIGILPVGETAKDDTACVSCIVDGSGYRELNNVIAENGALVGCFDYQGKTALYVVNYDKEDTRNITLQFDREYEYETICAAGRANHTGTVCKLTLTKGDATLIVIK